MLKLAFVAIAVMICFTLLVTITLAILIEYLGFPERNSWE